MIFPSLQTLLDFLYLAVNVFEIIYKDDAISVYTFPQPEIERANFIASNKFPDHFHFGVASSAYECEGAWNVAGMLYISTLNI